MPSSRRFYRTVYELEVLSDEPLDDDMDLIDVANEIMTGDSSGKMIAPIFNEIVAGPQMAKLLIAQESSPEFFNLTDEGEDFNLQQQHNCEVKQLIMSSQRYEIVEEGDQIGDNDNAAAVYQRTRVGDEVIIDKIAILITRALAEKLVAVLSKEDTPGAAEEDEKEPSNAAEEDEDDLLFRNYYKCYRCGHEWTDDWPAMCDDDCESCGARHCSPYQSNELKERKPDETTG